ncbi:MAG: hypothetical protein AB2591_03970 [Candidatus Thiodiazotropha sp.]
MPNNIKELLSLALVISGLIIGLVLVVKLAYVIWESSIQLAGFVLSILNFVLNFIALILAIVGPLILIGVIAFFAIKLTGTVVNAAASITEKSTEQFKTLSELIISRTSQWLPVLLGALTQVILLTLSDSFAPDSVKVISSIGLWTIVSVVLFISNSEGYKKLLGWLLLMILCGVTSTVIYWLSIKGSTVSLVQKFKGYIQSSASMTDLIGISFILFCVITLLIVALVTRQTPLTNQARGTP